MSDLCCHAVQDKVFVSAPDVPHGWWEFYAVTDDTPDEAHPVASVCCSDDPWHRDLVLLVAAGGVFWRLPEGAQPGPSGTPTGSRRVDRSCRS